MAKKEKKVLETKKEVKKTTSKAKISKAKKETKKITPVEDTKKVIDTKSPVSKKIEEKKVQTKEFYAKHFKKNSTVLILSIVIGWLILLVIHMCFIIGSKNDNIDQMKTSTDTLEHSITKVQQEYKDVMLELEREKEAGQINIDKLEKINSIINK